MVQCSTAACALSDHHNHNRHKMVLFTAPKKPKERVCRGKDGECNDKKNSTKSHQNEALMSSINRRHANGCAECSGNARCRMCLRDFYPSVITCDSVDRH